MGFPGVIFTPKPQRRPHNSYWIKLDPEARPTESIQVAGRSSDESCVQSGNEWLGQKAWKRFKFVSGTQSFWYKKVVNARTSCC